MNTFIDVPCNGCNLCCRHDAIRLLPEDDPSDFITVPHFLAKNELMIAHKENGDCIYLRSWGCAVHAKKPKMCKDMDCRKISQVFTRFQSMQLGRLDVWDKGKELLQIKTT